MNQYAKEKFILPVCLIIAGIIILIAALTYSPKEPVIEPVSDVDLSAITDFTTVYFDELEVLERYAFQTKHEYEGDTYEDLTFYVYDGTQPMDNHELHSEYYIVKFCDKDGKDYITAMSVYAKENASFSSANCPLKISVYAAVAPITEKTFLNNNEEELIRLREESLNAYSEETLIPRTGITLTYKSETLEQYQDATQKETNIDKIFYSLFGITLTVVGISIFNKNRKQRLA